MNTTRGTGTIRRSLWTGMGAVGLLLALGGGVALWSASAQTTAVEQALGQMQQEIELTLALSTGTARELLAADQYLAGDRTARATFDSLGFEVRRVYRRLDRLAGRTPADARLVAGIMREAAAAEAHYAVAHRLSDLGRADEARARATAAAPHARAALTALASMSGIERRTIAAAAARLSRDAQRRSLLLLALLASALLLAGAIARRTVRSVAHPLAGAVGHARRLSAGDLTARSEPGRLPGEFAVLHAAMDEAAASLGAVAGLVARTAEEVASSANTMAAGAEEITASASEIAGAMANVSEGAETNLHALRTVTASLEELRGSAGELDAGAERVGGLADAIELSAREKQAEITQSVLALRGVRDSVRAAASDVDALKVSTAEIVRLVEVVSAIASQSKLLALNAAIEAARAGEHGRGFGVVADEVGKLTQQTHAAAQEIARTTDLVGRRIESAAASITKGVARVGEIERLSNEIDAALATIARSAAGTREAAVQVREVAARNSSAINLTSDGLSDIDASATRYAAAAQQVSAATQEQSASCEEVSAIAVQLMATSTELQEAVARFRLDSLEPTAGEAALEPARAGAVGRELPHEPPAAMVPPFEPAAAGPGPQVWSGRVRSVYVASAEEIAPPAPAVDAPAPEEAAPAPQEAVPASTEPAP